MFSALWDIAYLWAFDGGNSLTTAIHPHMDMSIYAVLGSIISHGYLSTGFLPIQIAFPVLVACLKGPDTTIKDNILLDSFMDYVSSYEESVLRNALNSHMITDEDLTNITSIPSRVGCRQKPTSANLRKLLTQIASHLFLIVPVGALYGMSGGVPVLHHQFWHQFAVDDLRLLVS